MHFSASSAAATPSPSSLSQPLLIGRAKAKPSRKRKASLPHHVSGPRGKRARQRFRSEGWRTGSDNKTTSAGPYSDRASLSPPPPTQRVKERTELGNYNKLPLKIQKPSMTITDIVFHPVASSAELGFLTAVIRNAPSVFATGGRELLNALEESVLDDGQKLENMSIQPLALSIALLTASICNTNLVATSFHTRRPTLQTKPARNKTEKAILAVERQPRKPHAVGRCEDETSSEDDSPSDLGGYSSEDSDSTSDDNSAAGHGAEPLRLAKRLPWTRGEDDNLRRWREGSKDWNWIFSQFRNRTLGAVRTRWHTRFQQKGT